MAFLKNLKPLFLLSLVLTLLVTGYAFAANIDSTSKYSQFMDVDLDNDAIDDQINWSPLNGGATVADDAITGYIWGETVGWINLDPTNGGVENTCDGELSGYAWGQNTGWINFSPTNAGVTIDTTTGEFDGDAWAQNYGWITFDCESASSCVITEWQGCVEEEEDDGGGFGPIPTYICSDNIDNDGDGYTDYPSDAGCISSTDSSEYNPSIFTCSNGLDDDNDGLFDYPMDPGCTGPYDMSEYNVPVDPLYDVCPDIPGNQPIGTDCSDPVDPIDPEGEDPEGEGDPLNPGEDGESGDGQTPGILSGIITNQKIKSMFDQAMPVTIALSTLGLLSTIPGFATRIANLIFSIPFYRRRRPWGIVFDAETKETLDPVYVTVYNAQTNKIIDSKITDINGRYGFLLPLGTYRIEAGKTHYQFPSQKLPRTNSDGVYDNLYFGEVFSVTDATKDAVVTLNIPMDRLAADWNQEEKRRLGIVDIITRNMKLWARLSLAFFIVGGLFSLFALFVSASLWNIIVFALYIIFTILQLTGNGPIRTGTITDRSGKPVPHAIVRVWSAHLGTQIAQRVTDEYGRYYILVAKGDYYITVDVKNTSGGFDRVHTSETLFANQGLINEYVTLNR